MTKKTEKYTPFDAADYLDGIDDVASYLEIALEESAEDPTAVPRALGCHRSLPEHERTRSPRRHEPRRPIQGAVRSGQPDLVNRPEGDQRTGAAIHSARRLTHVKARTSRGDGAQLHSSAAKATTVHGTGFGASIEGRVSIHRRTDWAAA